MSKPQIEHKSSYIPTEFYLEDVREKLNKLCTGENIRIGHAYKEDGSECSIGKDSCMIITKYHKGYYFFCFRCDEQGWVDEHKSPKQVIADAKREVERKDAQMKRELNSTKFGLPYDCVPATDMDVPNEATGWLNRYHIGDWTIEKYNIQYSKMYDRLIFPIYEYHIANKRKFNTLIGWCGRCYHDFDKTERVINRRPKYLTKKAESHKHDRIYWCEFNKDSTHTVIVEDIVSAIRIHEVTGHSVLALLTTSMPSNIMGLFQDYCIVWLDDDAKGLAFKHVTKMNRIGTKAYFLTTLHDPKTFNNEDIFSLISRRIKNADTNKVA